MIFRGPGRLFTEDGGPSKSRSKRFVNRSLGPDSVRHMSVTTAMQRLTVTHHDTQRDSTKKAHKAGNTQLRAVFAGGGR